MYHTAIFIIPPKTTGDIVEVVGDANPDYEKIMQGNKMIYWSAKLDEFSKSRWSKIASTKANSFVTIRTANTVKKILVLMDSKERGE